MQKSLTKNSIFNIIYTLANVFFPFITSVYVSRILLPNGVGKVVSAQNIAAYFVTFAALGLPSYGVREFSKVRNNDYAKNKLFTELLILNVISTTLAVLGFYFLVYCNDGFDGEWALYLTCGLTIFFNYLNIDWMYRGLEEYGYITCRSLFIKIVSLISLFIFVNTQSDYVIYALISSIAIGGNYFFNVIQAKKYVRIESVGIDLSHHLKPMLVIACIIFLSSIYNKIDITMLSYITTNESVGYYAYAQKTINIVLTLANAVTAALLPRLSYYYDNDRKGFYRLIDKGFQILCFMTLPLSAGMALVAPQTVKLLYGESFSPAALSIQLMCPLILIKSFGDLFCYQLIYSIKYEKIILPAAALASAINVFSNAILIPVFLHNGAVIASVISELTTNILQFIYIKRSLGLDFNRKVLLIGLLSTAIMIICVLGIMLIDLPNVIGLILEIVCGAIVYVAVNILMRNELVINLIEKINKNRIYIKYS